MWRILWRVMLCLSLVTSVTPRTLSALWRRYLALITLCLSSPLTLRLVMKFRSTLWKRFLNICRLRGLLFVKTRCFRFRLMVSTRFLISPLIRVEFRIHRLRLGRLELWRAAGRFCHIRRWSVLFRRWRYSRLIRLRGLVWWGGWILGRLRFGCVCRSRLRLALGRLL